MSRRYKAGDVVNITIGRKRKRVQAVRIVARWASGEGDGYVVTFVDRGDEDNFDIKATQIMED